MSVCVGDVAKFMTQLAPLGTAADWDNVGLLLGDRGTAVARVITCLTVTPEVVREAIDSGANLIVTHHPILFRGVKQITAGTSQGQMLMDLIRGGVSVFSAHTAYDNAALGINDQIGNALGLRGLEPLRLGAIGADAAGAGRIGVLEKPLALGDIAGSLKSLMRIKSVRCSGDMQQRVQRIAIACGAGGDLLSDAMTKAADLFITGEIRFHDALSAAARGVALLLPGHYASERFAMEDLAGRLQAEFRHLQIWASRVERDPLITV